MLIPTRVIKHGSPANKHNCATGVICQEIMNI